MTRTAEHDGGAAPEPAVGKARASHAMLLGRITRGERAAFEELLDRFVAPVHGLVLAIVGDADRAAEVVTLFFVDLWRSPSDLVSAPGTPASSVEARILAAAHRRAVQSARGQRKHVTIGDRPEPGFVPRPSARVLERIPDPDAVTALGLAYFGARTIGEISKQMEMPRSRVATLLSRGLAQLRRSSSAR